MEYLFSYGTLQKSDVQAKLFGRILNGEKDVLRGYRISRIEIKDSSFLAKGEREIQNTLVSSETGTDFIEGTVFEVSEEELLLVDEYEPDNYQRMKVTLQSGKKAWIYLAA